MNAEHIQRRVDSVRHLLNPKNVAIVGASDRPGNWALGAWQALDKGGYGGKIYPVNPRNETIWGGKTCYASLSALPEAPDHVIVVVPGEAAIATIEEAGRCGARSATVFSSGFGEGGDPEGRARGSKLTAAIREAGLAVSGPNCMGNIAAPFGFQTLRDDRVPDLARGPVAVLGQSGGIVMAIFRALYARGIRCSYSLTTGNELGLTTPDYIRFLAGDADTKVIVCFIESIRDPQDFRDACRVARDAGKPIVAMKIGGSEASRAAALAHTGSLAGALDCFDAVARSVGVIRVDTIDDVVELTDFLIHSPPPKGPRLGALTFSGGLKGLMLEAGSRHGIDFPDVSQATRDKLAPIVGVGTSLGNPLDAGFAALSSAEAYFKCIDIMLEDENIDTLLVQEELPQVEGTNRKAQNLKVVNAKIAAHGGKPVAVISMVSYMFTDYSRGFRSELTHLPVLHEVDKGVRAAAAAGRYGALVGRKDDASRDQADEALKARVAACLKDVPSGATALDERKSKELLALVGIRSPREVAARTADEAVRTAKDIGGKVVLKVLSADILHKSDIGGVMVGVEGEPAVREAFQRIIANAVKHKPDAMLEGVLVAEMISGGVELVAGIQRDPEVGPVVMFGAGGVLLEVARDVSFGPVPLAPAEARDMIAATNAGKLLDGYRGQAASDRAAVATAIVALARLADALGERIEAIDINPLVALPGAGGLVALDALVVLRAP